MKIDRLGHLAIYCNRFEETFRFYTEILGFKRLFDLNFEDGTHWLTYIKVNKGQFIELFDQRYEKENSPESRSFMNMSFEVENLREVIEKIQSEGIPVYKDLKGAEAVSSEESDLEDDTNSLHVFIKDPEDNEIELIQFTDKSLQLAGCNKRLLDSKKINLTSLSLKCNKFEEMVQFYRDFLGMEEIFTTEYTEMEAAGGKRPGDPKKTYLKVSDREFVVLYNVSYEDCRHTGEYSFMHANLMVEDIVAAARHCENLGIGLWAGPKKANKPYIGPYPGTKYGLCGSKAFYIQDPQGNELEIMQYTEKSMQINMDTE